MSREWKPGDVAISKGFVIFRAEHGEDDRWHDKHGPLSRDRDWATTVEIRPLVVIDPEDREQVERLLTAIYNQPDPLSPTLHGLADALREFANPTPPKPAEPTGLGAVVEDSQGERWVRVAEFSQSWRSEHAPTLVDYALIGAVRVISVGVTR